MGNVCPDKTQYIEIEMLHYLRDLSGVRMPGQGKSLLGSGPGSEPGSAGSVWRFQFWHVAYIINSHYYVGDGVMIYSLFTFSYMTKTSAYGICLTNLGATDDGAYGTNLHS